MNRIHGGGLFLLGVCIALGLSVAGFFVSQTLYNSKVALNTAEVKGLAERRVKADRVNWTIGYKVVGTEKKEIPGLYNLAEQHQQTIKKLLLDNGFEDSEIQPGIVRYEFYEYRDKDQNLVDESHRLVGTIGVESTKVELVGKVRNKVNKLISSGIDIDNRQPLYYFTKLNEIKPDMLREATQNARAAANEFAKNAGVTVGGIRSARQGNFVLRDAGEQYENTTKVEKDVRVVTTITFYLTE